MSNEERYDVARKAAHECFINYYQPDRVFAAIFSVPVLERCAGKYYRAACELDEIAAEILATPKPTRAQARRAADICERARDLLLAVCGQACLCGE